MNRLLLPVDVLYLMLVGTARRRFGEVGRTDPPSPEVGRVSSSGVLLPGHRAMRSGDLTGAGGLHRRTQWATTSTPIGSTAAERKTKAYPPPQRGVKAGPV